MAYREYYMFGSFYYVPNVTGGKGSITRWRARASTFLCNRCRSRLSPPHVRGPLGIVDTLEVLRALLPAGPGAAPFLAGRALGGQQSTRLQPAPRAPRMLCFQDFSLSKIKKAWARGEPAFLFFPKPSSTTTSSLP